MQFKHYFSIILSCIIFGAIDYAIAFYALLITYEALDLPYFVGVCIATVNIAIIEGFVFHLIIPAISDTIYTHHKQSILTIVLCHLVALIVAIVTDLGDIDWQDILFWFMIFVPFALFRSCGLIIKAHKDKKKKD